MGIFGGDATHLHSWGSIFVQDILVPLRRTPFGPRVHLWILRCSIVGVACAAFLFGTFFQIADYVSMWWTVTTAVFVSGAGSAIIGASIGKKGLRRALGRDSSPDRGCGRRNYYPANLRPLSGRVFPQRRPDRLLLLPDGRGRVRHHLVLTYREDFNLDRMLHRGAYRSGPAVVEEAQGMAPRKAAWGHWIGIDENFTVGDKWIAGILFCVDGLFGFSSSSWSRRGT